MFDCDAARERVARMVAAADMRVSFTMLRSVLLSVCAHCLCAV